MIVHSIRYGRKRVRIGQRLRNAGKGETTFATTLLLLSDLRLMNTRKSLGSSAGAIHHKDAGGNPTCVAASPTSGAAYMVSAM
jgi:hypothetical protein